MLPFCEVYHETQFLSNIWSKPMIQVILYTLSFILVLSTMIMIDIIVLVVINYQPVSIIDISIFLILYHCFDILLEKIYQQFIKQIDKRLDNISKEIKKTFIIHKYFSLAIIQVLFVFLLLEFFPNISINIISVIFFVAIESMLKFGIGYILPSFYRLDKK